MNLKAKFQRWCMLHLRFHITVLDDMATGDSGARRSVPLTGWRQRCILCGRTFDIITQLGLELISIGVPQDNVLQWFKDKHKENK